jgi:DNA gyrase subunit A
MARRRKKKGAPQIELPMDSIEDASLVVEAQRRYLNYALSVITSRALPDVRDGLKPVQRRILYAMYHELRLRSDVKHRKSAAIVGDVMGKFHPHGDTAIYDALVRMAQSFTLREPLVDGRGNFGSPDGDSAAAMRYTEARLQKLADELLVELAKKTVAFRPNYDGRLFEPIVLPARFPNLLINGSQGIAVGMATSIPPHNLSEVIQACVALIDGDLSTKQLMKFVKGPDFPTGGELISSKSELAAAYEDGHGSLKLRGEWKTEKPRSGNPSIVIHSIPYSVERSTIVEKIAEVIIARKLPLLLDVRDESTDDCRIVCEMKKDADPQLIMAYLYKNTPLQTNVQPHLPGPDCQSGGGGPAAPWAQGDPSTLPRFPNGSGYQAPRVRARPTPEAHPHPRRLRHHLRCARRGDSDHSPVGRQAGRGPEADEALQARRAASRRDPRAQALPPGKATNARDSVRARPETKGSPPRAEAAEEPGGALEAGARGAPGAGFELRRPAAHPHHRQARRTRVRRGGFHRRRGRDGGRDGAGLGQAAAAGEGRGLDPRSKRRPRVGRSGGVHQEHGGVLQQPVCYVSRIVDIAATTGHGTPLQTMFKMADGERIVGAMGFDPRFLEVPPPDEESEEPEPPYAIGVTRGGLALRFSLRGHREPSTRSGRKFTRPKKGDEVIYVAPVFEEDCITCQKDDEVLAARVLSYDDDVLIAQREGGSEYRITLRKYEVVSRGGKGFQLFTRGAVEGEVYQEPEIPIFPED